MKFALSSNFSLATYVKILSMRIEQTLSKCVGEMPNCSGPIVFLTTDLFCGSTKALKTSNSLIGKFNKVSSDISFSFKVLISSE